MAGPERQVRAGRGERHRAIIAFVQRAVAVVLALVAAAAVASSAPAAKGPTEHQLALAGLTGGSF